MEYSVRWFQPKDAGAIVRIHYENRDCFEEDRLTHDFVIASAERTDFKFMVVEFKGEVVGFAGALYYPSVGRAEIGPISVEKDLQNRGAGSLLVQETLNFLRSVGVHRVVAIVKASNQKTYKFFTDNGFSFEANLKKYTRMKEDAIQLFKLLE